MIHTVHVTADREAIREALAGLPQEVTGGGSVTEAILLRAGIAVLGNIHRAFVTKSRGGTDEAGDRWAPLKPSTIAYSRRGRTRAERGRADRPSQALTSRQQNRWWDLYRQGLAIYDGDKANAAKRAWGILRAEGAVTLFDKYSNRSVDILRDTGLLLNSLSPGIGSPDQVMRTEGSTLVVGTNRKGAAAHHSGVPGKLPQRRLWPEPARWPDTWWHDILEQVRDGVVDTVTQTVRNA